MNIDNENNENLIEQEPDFIKNGDSWEEPEQLEEPEEPEQLEEPEEPEQLEEPEEEATVQSETQVADYSNHFIILENLGYMQIVFLGTFLVYFLLVLVYKFIKSFF